MAPETVFHFRAGSPGERRSHFAVNPTTWALKASAVLGLEARKAVLQDSCGPEVRLYFSFARRYVRKFMFQIDGALFGVASNLGSKLPYFPHVGHFLSPTTGTDKPQRMRHFEIGRLLGLSGEARTRERSDHEERRHGYVPARSDAASSSACISRLLTSCGIVMAKLRRIGEMAQPSSTISMMHTRRGPRHVELVHGDK